MIDTSLSRSLPRSLIQTEFHHQKLFRGMDPYFHSIVLKKGSQERYPFIRHDAALIACENQAHLLYFLALERSHSGRVRMS